jgi:tetratricopeptide (TPR) repeat protein
MTKLRWGILLLVLAVMLPLAAHGQELDERQRAAARDHYAKATSFFDLGRYDEAVAEYESAYQIKNDPALLYNIAQSHRLAGHAAPALRFYKRYLARQPDATNRAEVEAKIASLERVVEEQRKSQNLPPDQTLTPSSRPAVAPPVSATATPPAAALTPPVERPGRNKQIAGIAVAGAGVGLLVGGIVCAVLAKNTADSIARADASHGVYDPKQFDTLHTDQVLTGVLFGLGGAALAGGGVLFALGRRDAVRASRAELTPSLSPRFAGVSLTVRY